jgi:hypothetical protein
MQFITSRPAPCGAFIVLFVLASAAHADIAGEQWPRKIRDLPQPVPATVAAAGFRITVLEGRQAQTRGSDGTGGAPRELIVQNIRNASKRVFNTQSVAIAVLESYGGWPQFEVWTRPGIGSWCRSLYRLTPRGYQDVRTDEFTELDAKATDKDRTARLPGDEGEVLYYVETRLPKPQ